MDMIERLDLLEPNDYSPEQKLRWLSELDGKLYLEVVKTHAGAFAPYPPCYESGEEELLVSEPYGESLYYHYLQAMVAAENGENQRYNRRMTLFNSALADWTNWVNRSRRPCARGAFRF